MHACWQSYAPANKPYSDAATQLTARYPQDIDVAEKKAIPAYTAGLLQNGLYATFDDFKNNHPTQQVFFYRPLNRARILL